MEEAIIGTKDNEDLLDRKVLVLMRDGKYFYGIFRSFDQFNNITLENAVERMFFEDMFSDRRIGLHVIRGENIVLAGCPRPSVRKPLRRVKWSLIQEKLAGEPLKND